MGRFNLSVWLLSAVIVSSAALESVDKKSQQLEDDRSALIQSEVLVQRHQAQKSAKDHAASEQEAVQVRDMLQSKGVPDVKDIVATLKWRTYKFNENGHKCSDTLRQSQGVTEKDVAGIIDAVQKAFQCFDQAAGQFLPVITLTAQTVSDQISVDVPGTASLIHQQTKAEIEKAAKTLTDALKKSNSIVQQDWNSTLICGKWTHALALIEGAAAHYSSAIIHMSPMSEKPDLNKVVEALIVKLPHQMQVAYHDYIERMNEATRLMLELTPETMALFKESVVFAAKGTVCKSGASQLCLGVLFIFFSIGQMLL